MQHPPHPPDPEPNPEHRRGLDDAVRVLSRELELGLAPMILDVGCNTGNWLRAFGEAHGEFYGIGLDVAEMIPKLVIPRQRFVAVDLTKPLHAMMEHPFWRYVTCAAYDLCLCLEVGEHLEAKHAPRLVTLCTLASPTVLFSAATPGQGGHGHVNEQPHAYWRDLFAAEGYGWDESIREKLPLTLAAYYRNNMAVCRREGP